VSGKRKLGLIEVAWRSYLNEVLPGEAGETQRRETRRAFFAGARAFFACSHAIVSDDKEPTEADLAGYGALVDELDAFSAAIERGDA
jgi:hypothetical protein